MTDLRTDALTATVFDRDEKTLPAHRDALVLEFVNAHPRCTCREIAQGVFGGSGITRSPERAAAHAAIARLWHDARVDRVEDFDERGNQMFRYKVPHLRLEAF